MNINETARTFFELIALCQLKAREDSASCWILEEFHSFTRPFICRETGSCHGLGKLVSRMLCMSGECDNCIVSSPQRKGTCAKTRIVNYAWLRLQATSVGLTLIDGEKRSIKITQYFKKRLVNATMPLQTCTSWISTHLKLNSWDDLCRRSYYFHFNTGAVLLLFPCKVVW